MTDEKQLRTPAQAAGEPLAWRWRTLPKHRGIGDTDEWRVVPMEPTFINPHHHEVQPLYAAPPQPAPDLTDPVVVHANMLRGTIAKPTWEQISHLYPEQFTEIARAAEAFATIAEGHVGATKMPSYDEACRDIAKAIRDAAPEAPQRVGALDPADALYYEGYEQARSDLLATREAINKAADNVVSRVAEYDDRTSPDDFPEALLITPSELHLELVRFAEDIGSLSRPERERKTMGEHTKLPWRVKPDTALIEQFENGLWGLTVADCSMTDEGPDNAAFIVKAVNAHGALVKALQEIADTTTDLRIVNRLQVVEDIARTAIAAVGGVRE